MVQLDAVARAGPAAGPRPGIVHYLELGNLEDDRTGLQPPTVRSWSSMPLSSSPLPWMVLLLCVRWMRFEKKLIGIGKYYGWGWVGVSYGWRFTTTEDYDIVRI